MTLAVREHGDPANPAVVLVHGWPDNQTTWDRVVPLLSPRLHVVTYDVRGGGESTVPPPRAASYRYDRLLDDLAAVLDAVSPDRPAHLVGHDWGSIQLWEAVSDPRFAGRIASFTSISGPWLANVSYGLRRRLASPRALSGVARQAVSSFYLYPFAAPRLSGPVWRRLVARGTAYRLIRLWGPGGPDGDLADDGANGMWLYRANLFGATAGRTRPRGHAHAPVQLIVATEDRAVRPDLFDHLDAWVPDLRRREIATGHWVQRTHPDEVAGWVSEFVTEVEGRTARR